MWPWKKNKIALTVIAPEIFEIMLKNAKPDRIDALTLDLTLVEETITFQFPRAIWAYFKQLEAKTKTEAVDMRKFFETAILSWSFGQREGDLAKGLQIGHAFLVLAKESLEKQNKKDAAK